MENLFLNVRCNRNKNNLTIVGFLGRHLPKLIRLLCEVAEEVYVIPIRAHSEKLKMKNNVYVFDLTHKVSSNAFIRTINHIFTQLKVTICVAISSKKSDIFFFFIGGECLLIPIIVLKLLRKKVVVMPGGITTRISFIKKDPLFRFIALLANFSFRLADKLILYSYRLVYEMNLANYHHKVTMAHEHFVNFTRFIVKKKVGDRLDVIGYIGRLSKEKGILNLIKAMPLILERRPNTRVVICGDGVLLDDVRRVVKANGLQTHVELTGSITHEDVPHYLNEFKILVLPSFTEGLPNIILEAMACGTPVLVTPVGAIPDIIREGETGFLLKSNDPKHIAERIIELLSKPELLKRVSIKAHGYVRENFSFQKTLESWQKIFSELHQS